MPNFVYSSIYCDNINVWLSQNSTAHLDLPHGTILETTAEHDGGKVGVSWDSVATPLSTCLVGGFSAINIVFAMSLFPDLCGYFSMFFNQHSLL